MRFDVISLFPEFVSTVVRYGVTGRAMEQKLLEFQCWNPRDFTRDRHQTVDDRPYGGGPGMVMLAEPLSQCIEAARNAAPDSKVVLLSPQGRTLTQQSVRSLAEWPGMILVAGRYEGIDERLIRTLVDEEWSIGDYVLSGGELAAMVLIDAVARMLPGVLGDAESALQDSFMNGLLDCPHYTRPELWRDQPVPQVLLSGNHAAIARWRRQQALGRTWERRPELINASELSATDRRLLDEYRIERERERAIEGEP
ncbi:MAG TPA: tRNA (guanosine(37)-N1)-methyltransferase TrmD [Gammaproteobacteria bacterium]|nr:tRNA (guanosine(37)-N1)-methyltransferase TrmD [Gammaproteobacteria bacterium]